MSSRQNALLDETLDMHAKKQEESAMTTVEVREPQTTRERGLQDKTRAQERQAERDLVEEKQAERKIPQ